MAVQEENESSLPSRPLIRFDLFELDAKNGHLYRSGLPVELSPQLLRVLAMLAERPSQLVTRKEIKEELWPGQSYGDFDSRLNFAIKKLRTALGDDAERPRYVQTVRNAGYRFIAAVQDPEPTSSVLRDPVDHSETNLGGTLQEPTPEILAARNGLQVGMGGLFLVLVTIVIMAAAAVGVLALRQRGPSQSVFSEVSAQTSTTRSGDEPSIVSVTPILPQPRQRIVIKGTGFGLHVPYTGTDSPYLSIRDQTAHWAAGRIVPQNYDDVTLDVESWTDTEIVVTGFSGEYGRNGWKLRPGDSLEIAIWNPQSGVGPLMYKARVSPSAP